MIQYSVLYHDKRNDLMHKTIFYVPIKLTYIFNLENCLSQFYIRTDFWNVLKIVLKNKKNIDTQFYLYTPDFVFITNGLFLFIVPFLTFLNLLFFCFSFSFFILYLHLLFSCLFIFFLYLLVFPYNWKWEDLNREWREWTKIKLLALIMSNYKCR